MTCFVIRCDQSLHGRAYKKWISSVELLPYDTFGPDWSGLVRIVPHVNRSPLRSLPIVAQACPQGFPGLPIVVAL
jgi:hypothetical protein